MFLFVDVVVVVEGYASSCVVFCLMDTDDRLCSITNTTNEHKTKEMRQKPCKQHDVDGKNAHNMCTMLKTVPMKSD